MEYEKLLPNISFEENDQIEEKLIQNCPKPITLQEIVEIVEQMINNPICKVYADQKKGNGFFVKIPCPDNKNLFPVLITNNHIIDDFFFDNNKGILISQDDDNNKIKLEFKNRIKYTNKKYDITIIEIKEEDNINYFLELDKNINKNYSYDNETIYNLKYYQLQKLCVSFRMIKK